MGFFKDFKDDFSQAVNELMPGEDNLEDGAANEDLVVNTLENEVDVESELSKLDGLLEQVTSQTAKQQTSVQNQPVPSAPQPQPAGETKIEQPVIPENHVKNTQEERKMADNITPVVNETKPVSDEVSVITEGTIIKGDIVSNGSLDIRGNVQGDIYIFRIIEAHGPIMGIDGNQSFYVHTIHLGETVSSLCLCVSPHTSGKIYECTSRYFYIFGAIGRNCCNVVVRPFFINTQRSSPFKIENTVRG